MRTGKAHTCWLLAGLCLALAVVGCGGGSQGGASKEEPSRSTISGPLPEKGDLLFVMRGPATVTEAEARPRPEDRQAKPSVAKRDPEAEARASKVHDKVVVRADAVEWFTDRPKRKAGVAAAHQLVDNWKGYGFDAQPPNAAVAGAGTDAVVELQKPQKTPKGIAFEAVPLRGELPSKQDEQVSLFIDSSEWETDMHVYVVDDSPNSFCESEQQYPSQTVTTTLTNPNIITAPDEWSVAPPQSFSVGSSYAQIFNAASKNGGTNFEVEYDIECDGRTRGQVTFKGKVPDSLSSDSFSCSLTGNYVGTHCHAYPGSGYHVTSHAELYSE